MEERCREMEELQQRHDYFNMYKKVKEVTGRKFQRTPTYLIRDNNQIITEQKELEEEWTEYIKNMFDDERELPEIITDGYPLSILQTEVENAIKHAKTGKAPGPDGVYIEMLKLLNEENALRLCRLINSIYNTGNIPKDWLKSTFVPLPKKPNTTRCEQYRLLSMMSHALKITLKIIHHRIRIKCEQDVSEEQFGFRQGFGTREALFSLSVLLQKCRDQRKDVYLCFIDYEKAFDRVKHSPLINMLQKADLDGSDIRLIKNLYWEQVASVQVNDRTTDEVEIKRGVRQGCVLSPLLFNLYSEHIFQTALENATDGIKVNGKIVNNLRYADDTVIIADTAEGLQRLMSALITEGDTLGMRVNVNKTKVMIISRTPGLQANIHVYNQPIEQVTQFKYLGCWITNDLNPEVEIRARIEMARAAFLRMKQLLVDSTLSLGTRCRFIQVYIYPVLLYGMEAWTLGVRSMNRLEAFEMWLMRRMLKISWTEHVSNEEVLRRMGGERELLTSVKKQKTSYLGHIYRGHKYAFLRLLMEGKIEGKRGPGRRKCSWLKNIRDWTGMDTNTLLRTAQSREDFAVITAQLQ